MDEKEHKKAHFNKIYANITLGLRNEIMVVLENNDHNISFPKYSQPA